MEQEEVDSKLLEIDSTYKQKLEFTMNELKKRDSIIATADLKHKVQEKKQAEIKEKLLNIRLLEAKMNATSKLYVDQIRKLTAHYCQSINTVVFEWVRIKTAHATVIKGEATLKSLHSQINISYAAILIKVIIRS